MILSQPRQKINVTVRALIVHRGHLLLTRWKDGYAFPIGGRVEHGETLVETLKREVREETGREVVGYRLLYTNENFFPLSQMDYHEYGWFYLVELDRPAIELGETGANPDHPELNLEYVSIPLLGSANVLPAFLPGVLPADFAAGFPDSCKHIVSRTVGGKTTYEITDQAG